MPESSRAYDRMNTSPVQQQQQRFGVAASGAAAAGYGLPVEIDSQVALRAAQSNCTLLITGETGVGKGHLARWIHDHSPRKNGPFIPVNCGAIPESLVDSQLFGHARGSFSGATHDHLGLVRAADKGSLLLDEISELPHSAQLRLLRLLQEREVQPVGVSQPLVVDVRVIAATNTDLKRAVAERRFREDLLFRLDVIQLFVPPLRLRLREIPGLVRLFNSEIARLYRQAELTFDSDAMELLLSYHWPGNIRQVRTLMERLHVLCPGEHITAAQIVELGYLTPPPMNCRGQATLDQVKREHLSQVLAEAGGSIARAAELFGVHRSTIYRWLRRR